METSNTEQDHRIHLKTFQNNAVSIETSIRFENVNVILNLKAKVLIIDCTDDTFKISFQKPKSVLDNEQSNFSFDRSMFAAETEVLSTRTE